MKNVQIHRIKKIYIWLIIQIANNFCLVVDASFFFVHCQRKLIIGKLNNDRNKKKKEVSSRSYTYART